MTPLAASSDLERLVPSCVLCPWQRRPRPGL